MNVGQNSAALLPVHLANVSSFAAEADHGELEDWLGCESLHPLTWLPATPSPTPL